MSQENVEIVRRAIDAFNRRDFDTALRYAAPDAVVDWSHSRGGCGCLRGTRRDPALLDGPDRYVRLATEPDEFIPHGEHVVVPITERMTGRGGIEVEAKTTTVATVRDRRLVRWTMYQDTAEALRALGLEE